MPHVLLQGAGIDGPRELLITGHAGGIDVLRLNRPPAGYGREEEPA